MRPLLLSSHSRPLTQLKYNREGDLLFSCAKDHDPVVWYAHDGQRLGTFQGHNGTVWSCDVSLDSKRLLTASADSSVKIWDVETGADLFSFEFHTPCRSIYFAEGERQALLTTDPFMGTPSAIHILPLAEDMADQTKEPTVSLEGKIEGRITRAIWGDLNQTFYTAGEDGKLRIWDTEKLTVIKEVVAHSKNITDLQFSPDKTHFVTSSIDKTAKLWDAQSLQQMKMYENQAPVNSATIAPFLDHVVCGGGQDASQVTTTSHKAGKFESKFFHKIFEEEFGRVPGHFGPINTVVIHPNGRSFSTGGEDGYVRIHHFDKEYFETDSWFGTTKLRQVMERMEQEEAAAAQA